MTAQQIKENLTLYRVGTQDENDPEMITALREAARNPELQAWFIQQQAFNLSVRAHLRRLQPPSDLKQRIMNHRAPAHKIVWWKRSEFLAIAAVIVLFFSLAGSWVSLQDPHRLAGLRQRMAKYALTRYRMDVATSDLGAIRTYLARNGGHGDYVLPRELEKLPGAGGAVLTWQSRPVSMVCFRLGTKDLLWLFVIDRAQLSDPPASVAPRFEPVGKLMTAAWSRDGKTYLLAGIGDEALLTKYL